MAKAKAKTKAKENESGTPRLIALAVFIGVALLAGWVGSIPTPAALETWYAALEKPPFTPPDAVFPVVWTLLYLLMGLAAWIVWMAPGSVARNTALTIFFGQLVLNAGWSWTFFGFRSIGAALAVIVALAAAVAWMAYVARRVDRLAAMLILPYLAWIGFAGILNTAIFLLN